MTSVIKTSDLHVRQFKTGCLAQYAYVVESQGQMAVVDPLRDTAAYLDLLAASQAQLRWVLETHYHADFVSGHVDLASRTGAAIVFGPDSCPAFPCKVAAHDELLPLGNYQIRVLHTPGHTFESASFVLEAADGKALCVFTGDTLFLGDVGRPDLAQKGTFTDKDLAHLLFKSLRLLKKLPDDCIVLPAHGAGSACGKNIQAGDFCIMGNQKKSNAPFAEEDEEKFVILATENMPSPPSYFGLDVALNKSADVRTVNQDLADQRGFGKLAPPFNTSPSQKPGRRRSGLHHRLQICQRFRSSAYPQGCFCSPGSNFRHLGGLRRRSSEGRQGGPGHTARPGERRHH